MFSIFGKDDERKKAKEGGSLLDRLKQSISKTRTQITAKVEDLISGEKKIDPELLTKLENALLAADLGRGLRTRFSKPCGRNWNGTPLAVPRT